MNGVDAIFELYSGARLLQEVGATFVTGMRRMTHRGSRKVGGRQVPTPSINRSLATLAWRRVVESLDGGGGGGLRFRFKGHFTAEKKVLRGDVHAVDQCVSVRSRRGSTA